MDLDPVHTFFDRVKKMQVGRSKEMRLTYEEAHKLSIALGQLMAKKLETSDDGVVQTVIMHGGSLKPS